MSISQPSSMGFSTRRQSGYPSLSTPSIALVPFLSSLPLLCVTHLSLPCVYAPSPLHFLVLIILNLPSSYTIALTVLPSFHLDPIPLAIFSLLVPKRPFLHSHSPLNVSKSCSNSINMNLGDLRGVRCTPYRSPILRPHQSGTYWSTLTPPSYPHFRPHLISRLSTLLFVPRLRPHPHVIPSSP